MTDIPIIFSAPMVRALLDGRKTQTHSFGWDLNPWVTAYTFTVQNGNIDSGKGHLT